MSTGKTLKALEFAALGLILLAAFLLHFIGLKFGYPLLTHTDEPVIVNPVVQMTANSTLDPGGYYRPDLILIYLNFLIFNAVSFLKFGKNVAVTFAGNELTYYFYGRLIVALIGTALPWVAYLVGREWRKNLAIPAALLFAFLPSFTLHSHYITPDVPTALFTLLVLLFATRYLKTGQQHWLTWAIIMVAVNTAQKYPGVISLGIVFAAILIHFQGAALPWGRKTIAALLGQMLRACVTFAIAFMVLAPSAVVNYGKVIDVINANNQTTHLGADGLGFWGNMQYYFTQYANQAGPLLVLLGLIGLFAIFKTRAWTKLIVLYGLFYGAGLSLLALHWERWGLPMYTAPLLLALAGYDYLHTVLRSRPLRWGISALGMLMVAWLFLSSAAISIELSYPDTRVAALSYCQNEGITPANAIYEAYSPFAPILQAVPIQYNYAQDTSRNFLILSSAMFARYKADAIHYPQIVAEYEQIQNQNPLLISFDPQPSAQTLREKLSAVRYYIYSFLRLPVEIRYSGPQILIYRVQKVAVSP
jgi:4-amino-4-deoxy-L-arabinose transferase-like glycosyltransferase